MDFVHENHKVTIAADGLTGSHTLRVEFTNCYDKTGVGLHRYIVQAVNILIYTPT